MIGKAGLNIRGPAGPNPATSMVRFSASHVTYEMTHTHTYTHTHTVTDWPADWGRQFNRVRMWILNMSEASSANNPVPYHHSRSQYQNKLEEIWCHVECCVCPHLFASLAWSSCRATLPWDARLTLGSHFTLGEWRGGSERKSESDQWHPKHIIVTCMTFILKVKMSHHTFCPSIPGSPFVP